MAEGATPAQIYIQNQEDPNIKKEMDRLQSQLAYY